MGPEIEPLSTVGKEPSCQSWLMPPRSPYQSVASITATNRAGGKRQRALNLCRRVCNTCCWCKLDHRRHQCAAQHNQRLPCGWLQAWIFVWHACALWYVSEIVRVCVHVCNACIRARGCVVCMLAHTCCLSVRVHTCVPHSHGPCAFVRASVHKCIRVHMYTRHVCVSSSILQ